MVFMPHWPKMLKNKPIDLGLDRVKSALELMGNPHLKMPPVIHVAGTNGKGSTIAMMAAIFKAAGYKAHIYTSPHLLNFNERITIAGNNISDEYLYQIMEECRLATEGVKLTFFEGTTLGAFLAFSKNPADVVLLETGLGGRLDATNVIEKPAMTVITPISLDHTEFLGPNVRIIAGEKAGILKTDTPCISSMQTDEAQEVLERKAQQLNSPLYSFGYDWSVDKTAEGMVFKSKDNEDIQFPLPSLYGDHQILNAGAAIAAIKNLEQFDISNESIAKGLQNIKWPGRLQNIQDGNLASMLPEGWELWLDGAHNLAGAHILSNIVSKEWQDKPLYIILGHTRGRDIPAFLSFFKDCTKHLCGILVKTEPSAYKAEDIAKAAEEIGIKSSACDCVEDAINLITSMEDKPARILCCGSLYLISDVLTENKNYK
ncbi:bifunctional folylpolyglutamate synthase/dihydrofolate synthase [Rickettsiales bacterium]|nr:bifunctional folylpolyglutamate synthase/dihydrofolate synthase [Rickettsiales bacterium]